MGRISQRRCETSCTKHFIIYQRLFRMLACTPYTELIKHFQLNNLPRAHCFYSVLSGVDVMRTHKSIHIRQFYLTSEVVVNTAVCNCSVFETGRRISQLKIKNATNHVYFNHLLMGLFLPTKSIFSFPMRRRIQYILQ